MATRRGACARTVASSAAAPARSSPGRSSEAARVGRKARLVTPMPCRGSSWSSSGRRRRGVNPAAWSVGQKRLPGRAKWWPTSAERSEGLIPTNRTRRPGPMIGPRGPSRNVSPEIGGRRSPPGGVLDPRNTRGIPSDLRPCLAAPATGLSSATSREDPLGREDPDGPDLDASGLGSRDLGGARDRLVEDVALEHAEAAELLLGLGEGAVGDHALAVLDPHGRRRRDGLEGLARDVGAVLGDLLAEAAVAVHHRVDRAGGDVGHLALVAVDRQQVLHLSLLRP